MIQKPFRGMQLNKAHPLVRGLVGCWIFNERTGETAFDLSGNGNNGTISEFRWESDGLYRTNAHGQIISLSTEHKPLDGISAFSIITKIRIDNDTIDNGIFYTDTHQLNEPIALWVDNAATDHFAFIVTTSAGTTGVKYSNFVPLKGVDYTVTLVYDGTHLQLYIDGASDIRFACGGTLNSTNSNYGWGNNSILNKPLQGSIKYGYLYNRALTITETSELSVDPYQMFRGAINPAMLYAAASAAGVSNAAAMMLMLMRRR